MSNTLILYYSKTGNNKLLATKIAERLSAEAEEITPSFNVFLALIFSSLFGLSSKIKPLSKNLALYDTIVVVGPIWMGSLLAPLKTVLKMIPTSVTSVGFATCCGSDEDECDGKFGYQQVFDKVEAIIGKPVVSEAISIKLIIPKEKLDDSDYLMKARLTEETMNWKVNKKIDAFVGRVTT